MNPFIAKILPIIAFFFLGIFFKYLKIFSLNDGHFLLKLVFYLFLPALAFISMIETDISSSFMIIPFLPIIPIAINFIFVTIFLRFFPQPKITAGVIYCAALIMNTGFTLPFFEAAYSMEGFSRAIMFDIGNSFIIYTFIYFIAVKHGNNQKISKSQILKKFLYMPPLWGLLIGLIVNLQNIKVSQPFLDFFEYASKPTIPVIMLALGLLFHPRLQNLPKALIIIAIRMIGGLLTGYAITLIIPLDALSQKIIIASCAAPVGYNTLVFAALENLDEQFGATIVSTSILIGIIYIPLIFLLIN